MLGDTTLEGVEGGVLHMSFYEAPSCSCSPFLHDVLLKQTFQELSRQSITVWLPRQATARIHRFTVMTPLTQQDSVTDSKRFTLMHFGVYNRHALKDDAALRVKAVARAVSLWLAIAWEDCNPSRMAFLSRQEQAVVAHLSAPRQGCQVYVRLIRLQKARKVTLALDNDVLHGRLRIDLTDIPLRHHSLLHRVEDHGVQSHHMSVSGCHGDRATRQARLDLRDSGPEEGGLVVADLEGDHPVAEVNRVVKQIQEGG